MTFLFALLIAQTPMGVATKVEAEGFRLSERARFHVGGNVDLKWDSNPAYYPTNGQGDLALRIRGIASVAQPGENLELSVNLSADWTQYLGAIYPGTRTLSAFQAALDGGLIANKTGWITYYLSEQLARVEQPANDAISQRLKSIRSHTRTGTDIRPGGRALEIRAQYGFDFIYYDQGQQSVVDPRALTHMTHAPALRGMWRFFPKTALTLDADAAFTRYPFPSSSFTNPALNAFRVQAGVLGQVTPKLTVVARAGYGNTFIMQAGIREFSSVIGLAQLTWKPIEVTSLTLGYTRDFAPTSVYGFVTFDRPFIEFQQGFLQRFAFHLRAQYEYQAFGTPVIMGLGARQDHVIRGEARFSYQALAWLAGSAYYLADLRFSRFVSPIGVPGAYQRHVVGIDVTAAY